METPSSSNAAVRRNPRGEPTGEAESLWGRIDPKSFGALAQREPAPINAADRSVPKTVNWDVSALNGGAKPAAKKRSRSVPLDDLDEIELLLYRPKTVETQKAFEIFLAFVQDFLTDQPHSVIKSAANELLLVLRGETSSDADKKRAVEQIVGGIDADNFSKFVNLSKKLVDFVYPSADSLAKYESSLDAFYKETEISVLFDDEEEEDEEEEASSSDENEEAMAVDGEPRETAPEFAEDSERNAATDEKTIPSFDPRSVDSLWLERQLDAYFKDSVTAHSVAADIARILERFEDPRECENELVQLLEFDKFDLIRMLVKNRFAISHSLSLSRLAAGSAERDRIVAQLQSSDEGRALLQKLASGDASTGGQPLVSAPIPSPPSGAAADVDEKLSVLDLESIAFDQGNHYMSNRRCRLPDQATKVSRKGYDEIHVPPPPAEPQLPGERLVPIAELPPWTHAVFGKARTLNRVQSKVLPAAFESDENLLLCAPTGAGKTNVALLTILRVLAAYRDADTGAFRTSDFKVVYVAPMKALVQEIAGNFAARLAPLGLNVAELTGDSQLTKAQLADTHVVVTTPEKWDIVTRKAAEKAYLRLVRLLIIDEIHLLHDDRGPVLECIVARTLRTIEQTQAAVRIVGLSATLPNFVDVARFLRVDPQKGLHHFNNSFRPCPLAQQYIGITERKALKKFHLSNEIVYEKILERAGKHQMLVFVHSRRETFNVARIIRDMSIERGTLGAFFTEANAASREILRREAENAKNAHLREILPFGFGIHHAALTRTDRSLVEDLFADGHVQVLFSTATLAWGVNLPAHTVIVKGTQVYSPERGRWVEIAPQDILQMLGRAGRPQYDTQGEGIIVTGAAEMNFYLSLLNAQLPIESQLVTRLVDALNAEVVGGGVTSRNDGVEWLGYTYLFVRMMKQPALYACERRPEDPFMRRRRADLVHSACNVLDQSGLIRYDRKTGRLHSTELGRIASHFYVSHRSIATFQRVLRPTMNEIDLFRVFSLAEEFALIPVRAEEKIELQKLYERVPIPIKEACDDAAAKINVLLQAFISQLSFEGFALAADMTFVVSNAARLMRAIFEVCLRKRWSRLALKALETCKMIQRGAWASMSPLRQFPDFPRDLVRSIERRDFPWRRIFDLGAQELGELVRSPKSGHVVARFLKQFPRFEVAARILPISRSILKVDLLVTPTFEYVPVVHHAAELLWIIVEDADGESVLYADTLSLKMAHVNEPRSVSFTLPLFDPPAAAYFVHVVSDRWLGCTTTLPLSLHSMILPTKFGASTDLLDLEPAPISDFIDDCSAYDFHTLNAMQTQVLKTIAKDDSAGSVFVGAPGGTGKSLIAHYAVQQCVKRNASGRIVFIVPTAVAAECVESRAAAVRLMFPALRVACSIGDSTADIKAFEAARIFVTSCIAWHAVSKKWKTRRTVQDVALYVCEDVHVIGGADGPALESLLARLKIVAFAAAASGRGVQTQFLLLSHPIATYADVCEWLDVSHAFNFAPSLFKSRPTLVPYSGGSASHTDTLIAMCKQSMHVMQKATPDRPCVVLVASRKLAEVAAEEVLNLSQLSAMTVSTDAPLSPSSFDDQLLNDCVQNAPLSFAVWHEEISATDALKVQQLLNTKRLPLLIASREVLWQLRRSSVAVCFDSLLVLGTETFDFREHRFVDYSIYDVLHATSLYRSSCTIFVRDAKAEFYAKFLTEPLPVESHLHASLCDFLLAECAATRSILNKQDAVDLLAWTFLQRRLAKNPSYYGVADTLKPTLAAFVSHVIEAAFDDLRVNLVEIDAQNDFDVTPTNFGLIASHYGLSCVTIDTLCASFADASAVKPRAILEVLYAAAVADIDSVPVRHGESKLLRRINESVPYAFAAAVSDFSTPFTKMNLLVQCHLSRIALPSAALERDLRRDILPTLLRLVYASVDVLSSRGWMHAALAAMECAQMLIQAVWDRDSSLKQIPHFTRALIDAAKREHAISSVIDFLEAPEAVRDSLLARIDPVHVPDVVRFCDAYPNVSVAYAVERLALEEASAETSAFVIRVRLTRESGSTSSNDPPPAHAPFFPQTPPPAESYWVAVGDGDALLAIKRVSFAAAADVELRLTVDTPPTAPFKLFVMCECYAGCDQEYSIEEVVTAISHRKK